MLSVIIPAYNEEKCIKSTYNVIHSLLAENNIDSEFVFVDDGSRDQTYKMITELSAERENITGLHFFPETSGKSRQYRQDFPRRVEIVWS